VTREWNNVSAAINARACDSKKSRADGAMTLRFPLHLTDDDRECS
jgi:hypothetical protein